MNKEIKQNQTYLSPKVTVVNFKVEGGFQNSPGPRSMAGSDELQLVTQGNNLSNTNTLTRWE